MADLSTAYDSLRPSMTTDAPTHYIRQCIHCGSNRVSVLTNDGGSVQMCNCCGKSYRARKSVGKSNLARLSNYDIVYDD